ncbi:putative HMG box protein, partial [Gaertneriomyces semiglobifer]
RPLNPFILYRRERHACLIKQNPDLKNNDISTYVGKLWLNEPEFVKALYQQRSNEEKRMHQLRYPDYKFNPR